MIQPNSDESPSKTPGVSFGLGQEEAAAALEDFDTQSHASSRDPGSTQTVDPAVGPDNGTLDQRDDSGNGPSNFEHLNDDGKPAWSEMKTKAGKERKRLPLACIACRRKKIRCSGEKPACKHCTRSRIPCVYKVTTRKAAPRTDYMAMLDKRLKRMEDRVIKTIPKEETRDMLSIGRSVVKPSASVQPSKAQKKRSAEEAFAAEMDEWTRGNGRPPHETFPMNREIKSTDGTGLLTEGAEFLPSLEIQEHLAEVFFDCVYGQSYLLLHKPSFIRRLKAGTIPPVLILAVCAVSARFSTHPQLNSDPPFLRGENWANPAAAIALSRHDEPNITILTVFLLLGLHEFGTCHGGRSWSFGGQALRMAYALQLHQELDQDPLLRQKNGSGSQLSFTDQEIRRRTMWACYLMDRYNSSGSQRPPIGNEKFLQIQLPIKEPHFQMEIPGPTEDLDGDIINPVPEDVGQLSNAKENMGVSAYIIRAIVIWGRIVDYLNLGGKGKDAHPLWHPESGYTQLKRQIEEFSVSLPGSFTFTYENLQIHAAEKIANQFIFLHIIIHQNMLFLNQFAIPLSPGGRPPRDMPKSFLSNAGRAAVEAAHHISVLFDRASAYPLTVPFAGYCAYSASTVHIWGIFSKNVQLEARSKENLRLTYRYLNKMKKYWGMFHYMVESAKDRYRQFADAAIKGSVAIQNGASLTPMFQYGDWFDKYPHGVSRLHWEDPDTRNKETGEDAVMGQKPDLQSVEDFFAGLSPTPQPSQPRKSRSRNNSKLSDGAPGMDRTSPQSMMEVTMGNTPSVPGSAFPQPSMLQQSRLMSFGQPPFDFSIPPDQLPQLDRQFVYGSFSDFDPASFVPNNPPVPPLNGVETQSPDQTLFTGHLDPGAPAGMGEFYQPSAWFLPFNLDPVGGGNPPPPAPPPAPMPGGSNRGGTPSGIPSVDMSGFGGPGGMPLGAYDLGLSGSDMKVSRP
ncbi:Aflatoxin biosynthesis regulatory protein [Penicillium hordei]|uniref:Aflatoxin biosynthesis regulatory protein n=1 Tax=Penicillium hordei TaxID=40994 RepID=A0AAD6EF10_9EURO|nr:Aflatoxin biosynthesis regulatory protein [Penicillium hordei]KAJ5616057.1 Aflatoxin biosynthesis regulatory protein [Penicillium hordei]